MYNNGAILGSDAFLFLYLDNCSKKCYTPSLPLKLKKRSSETAPFFRKCVIRRVIFGLDFFEKTY